MAKYLRVTRTIVIEGPINWVRDVHDRCFCPAPFVGGLMMEDTQKHVICTAVTVEESDTPLLTERPK